MTMKQIPYKQLPMICLFVAKSPFANPQDGPTMASRQTHHRLPIGWALKEVVLHGFICVPLMPMALDGPTDFRL